MIYAPLRPLLRLWRIVIYFLANLDHILETDFDRYAFTEAGRRELEAGIAFGEDGINIMIYARTCELLGLTPIIKSPIFQEPAKSRPIAELLTRHARMLDRLRTFEQRAQRRAARILRQIEQAGPLGLDASHQSASPSLRLVEANHRALFVVQIASLSAQHWGRWIARVRAQDGGGSHDARGPPPTPYCLLPIPHCLPRKLRFRERPRMPSIALAVIPPRHEDQPEQSASRHSDRQRGQRQPRPVLRPQRAIRIQ